MIKIKNIHEYLYTDINHSNCYRYYVLQTTACTYLFYLFVNGIYTTQFFNDIEMFNDISDRRLLKL